MLTRMKINRGWGVAVLGLGVMVGGCSSLEYKVRESFGQHKRELLVDRVGDAKDSQESAKKEFISALAQFKNVTGFDGGDLERKYDDMKAEFDRCESRAEDVRKRINAVDDVAKAMFREWEGELAQYSSPSLRQTSERQLQQTKQAYDRLLSVMRAAAGRMDPVLATFRDQVLFLKHNLNARAISSLGGITNELQRNDDVLVADMERAIADANRFIETMQAPPAG